MIAAFAYFYMCVNIRIYMDIWIYGYYINIHIYIYIVNPSYHTTHTTKAERRAEEPLWRQRRQRVARRPEAASFFYSLAVPIYNSSLSFAKTPSLEYTAHGLALRGYSVISGLVQEYKLFLATSSLFYCGTPTSCIVPTTLRNIRVSPDANCCHTTYEIGFGNCCQPGGTFAHWTTISNECEGPS